MFQSCLIHNTVLFTYLLKRICTAFRPINCKDSFCTNEYPRNGSSVKSETSWLPCYFGRYTWGEVAYRLARRVRNRENPCSNTLAAVSKRWQCRSPHLVSVRPATGIRGYMNVILRAIIAAWLNYSHSSCDDDGINRSARE